MPLFRRPQGPLTQHDIKKIVERKTQLGVLPDFPTWMTLHRIITKEALKRSNITRGNQRVLADLMELNLLHHEVIQSTRGVPVKMALRVAEYYRKAEESIWKETGTAFMPLEARKRALSDLDSRVNAWRKRIREAAVQGLVQKSVVLNVPAPQAETRLEDAFEAVRQKLLNTSVPYSNVEDRLERRKGQGDVSNALHSLTSLFER